MQRFLCGLNPSQMFGLWGVLHRKAGSTAIASGCFKRAAMLKMLSSKPRSLASKEEISLNGRSGGSEVEVMVLSLSMCLERLHEPPRPGAGGVA